MSLRKKYIVCDPTQDDQTNTITFFKEKVNPAVLGIGLVILRTLREGVLIEVEGDYSLDVVRNNIRGFLLLKEFEAYNPRLSLKYFENTIPTEKLLSTIVNQNRALLKGIKGPYKKLEVNSKDIKLEGETIVKLILHIPNNQASPTNKKAFAVLEIAPKNCSKCLASGHKPESCGFPPVCSNCHGPHSPENCTLEKIKICYNCSVRKEKLTNIDIHHDTYSKQCPTFFKYVQDRKKTITYK